MPRLNAPRDQTGRGQNNGGGIVDHATGRDLDNKFGQGGSKRKLGFGSSFVPLPVSHNLRPMSKRQAIAGPSRSTKPDWLAEPVNKDAFHNHNLPVFQRPRPPEAMNAMNAMHAPQQSLAKIYVDFIGKGGANIVNRADKPSEIIDSASDVCLAICGTGSSGQANVRDTLDSATDDSPAGNTSSSSGSSSPGTQPNDIDLFFEAAMSTHGDLVPRPGDWLLAQSLRNDGANGAQLAERLVREAKGKMVQQQQDTAACVGPVVFEEPHRSDSERASKMTWTEPGMMAPCSAKQPSPFLEYA